MERLGNNYTNLSHSINNVTDSVNRQISVIAYQVENILNEQKALTADFGTSVAEVNAKEMTVSFDVYAVPKTYEACMTVEFLAESDNSETHSAEGIEGANARFSGRHELRDLVEIVELSDHPFYIGVQFHPEFQSQPDSPHPLFTGLVAAALKAREN